MKSRMMMVMVWLLVVVLAFGAFGQTRVKGYVRRDGTVVQSYERRSPGSAGAVKAAPAPAPRNAPKAVAAPRPAVRQAPVKSPSAPVKAVAPVVVRDSNGRIARSSSARQQFMKKSGYPNGRPGYVIDHITPLKRGGADSPANMQWQSVAQAKAKDKWE